MLCETILRDYSYYSSRLYSTLLILQEHVQICNSPLAFPFGVFLSHLLVQYISPLFCFGKVIFFFWFVLFWGVNDLARCCYTIAALMIDMIRKIDGVILYYSLSSILSISCYEVILLGDFSTEYVVLMHFFSVKFVMRGETLVMGTFGSRFRWDWFYRFSFTVVM